MLEIKKNRNYTTSLKSRLTIDRFISNKISLIHVIDLKFTHFKQTNKPINQTI